MADVETVTAKLRYVVLPTTDGQKPYQFINPDPATGERKKNYTFADHDFEIENVRGKEHLYSLDKTGFQFLKAEAKHKTFENDEEIVSEYYPESVELLKEVTGASRVVIFDHTIRRNRPDDREDTPQNRHPVPNVHVDQTPASAEARVHRHLPASDVPSLLQRRFQIINLWRPIHHAAFDRPLALCDFRSVDTKTGLVPAALKYPDHDGETFIVRYDPKHRWKYVRGMNTDEAVLIKCYDSIQDVKVAVLTPHTAFDDPTTPPEAPLRESIELRALVFYD